MSRIRRPLLALSLVEVLVATAILLYATFALFSVYSSSVRQERQSENRSIACRMAQSALDEWRDHPFGSPPCQDWGFSDGKATESAWVTPPVVTLIVEGRGVANNFHVKRFVTSGAVFGASAANYDVVTVVISWSEGGQRNLIDYGQFTQCFYQQDEQHLVAQIPVTR